MELDSDYWNALDAGKKLKFNPEQIGISHGVGDVGEGLKANVFRGAKVVELGFMGQGKGSRSSPGGHTPESYGIKERQEMKEMAKINEMEISVHASPNIGAFPSGFSERSNNFSPEARKMVLDEVGRAVDFAGDVTNGGPVVLHLMEFPRPLFKVGPEGKFEHDTEERKRAPVYLVDERTGEVQGLRRDAPISIPIPEKEGLDPWKHPKRDEKGMIKFETKTVADFENKAIDEGKDLGTYIYETVMKRQLQQYEGEAQRWTNEARKAEKNYKEIERSRTELEERKKKYPEEAKYEAIKTAERFGTAPSFSSPEYGNFLNDPFKYIKQQEDELKQQAEGYANIAHSNAAELHKQSETIASMKPIEEYGVSKSAETIALAAMNAYAVEKKRNLKNPLFIAPENWAPEFYGSHPDEYKNIIVQSRKTMENMLIAKKMDREQAKKVAEDHIKGTFDIGHANFMQKYFKGEKKEFDAWLDKETNKLVKDGIIGNVHVSDNFGYNDEHLAPGEGNVPIQRFMERLKEHGFKGNVIAEPGGQREGRFHTPLTEAWKMSGSPMYRIDTVSQTWTDIEGSYFGRAPQPPNFVVGDYAPSKDWTLWSEVPYE